MQHQLELLPADPAPPVHLLDMITRTKTSLEFVQTYLPGAHALPPNLSEAQRRDLLKTLQDFAVHRAEWEDTFAGVAVLPGWRVHEMSAMCYLAYYQAIKEATTAFTSGASHFTLGITCLSVALPVLEGLRRAIAIEIGRSRNTPQLQPSIGHSARVDIFTPTARAAGRSL